MNYIELGKAIRKRRMELRFTQEMLAERAGISFAFVGHIERGTRIPSFNTVCKLADALDCSIDELAGRYRGLPPVDGRAREIIQIINRIVSE